MLGQTFSRYILVLDYQLNKNYITRHLCENRDRPAMKCDGKCYLCKKLKKEDKKDQDNPERKADNKFEIIFLHQDADMGQPNRPVRSIAYISFLEMIPGSFGSACFHPPQC
jgi:hypothetical protein